MIFTWCSWSNTISRCSISSTPSKSVRRKPRQDSWRITPACPVLQLQHIAVWMSDNKTYNAPLTNVQLFTAFPAYFHNTDACLFRSVYCVGMYQIQIFEVQVHHSQLSFLKSLSDKRMLEIPGNFCVSLKHIYHTPNFCEKLVKTSQLKTTLYKDSAIFTQKANTMQTGRPHFHITCSIAHTKNKLTVQTKSAKGIKIKLLTTLYLH